MSEIEQINKVIEAYFKLNTSVKFIPVKDLMPYFIKAGVFPKDNRNGLPIRNVLRRLDAKNQLSLIPNVIAERKLKNTYWFFSNTKNHNLSILKNKITVYEKTVSASKKMQSSDEHYIIDLCDEILQMKGSRQHTFDFLLGDLGKTGRRKLPVDVYYESRKLVIEFNEQQHSKAVNHFDKPDQVTISGIHRGEQRKIYDKRKRTLLPQNGIKVLTITYDMFECSKNGKLVRNKIKDMEIVRIIINESINN